MEYIDIQWIQESHDHPFRLVSELDTQRYEIRKLEFFSGGRVGFASSAGRSPNTNLGSDPVPSLDEIGKQGSECTFKGRLLKAMPSKH